MFSPCSRPSSATGWCSHPLFSPRRAIWRLVSAAALGELGLVGYLDADASGPAWFAPAAGPGLERVEAHLADAPYDAPVESLDESFRRLVDVRRSLPAGTFVFVCSD